jgi:hypothetical protein
MIISKGLTRLGGVVALAALLLSAGFAFASTAHAQAPMLVYGPAASGAVIVVSVDGAVCETATVGAEAASSTGYLFVAQIDDGECGASSGSAITFTVDGAAANESASWSAGGAPADTAVGITLTTAAAAAAAAPAAEVAAPAPPDTGDAGLVAASSTSPLLALGLGALAVAMLAGARSVTDRTR